MRFYLFQHYQQLQAGVWFQGQDNHVGLGSRGAGRRYALAVVQAVENF